MFIRELSPDDAAAYWDLRLEALEREPFAFGKSAVEHRASTVEETAGRLTTIQNHKFNLGAFDGDSLIGTATFIREPGLKERHKGRIYGVYVTEAQRGKGVGVALISALVAKARTFPSLEQILLGVSAHQAAALRTYRRCGFQTFGIEPRAIKVGDDYVDEEHMILMLSATT